MQSQTTKTLMYLAIIGLGVYFYNQYRNAGKPVTLKTKKEK